MVSVTVLQEAVHLSTWQLVSLLQLWPMILLISIRSTMVPSNMLKRSYKIPENNSHWKFVYGILHPLWCSTFTQALSAFKQDPQKLRYLTQVEPPWWRNTKPKTSIIIAQPQLGCPTSKIHPITAKFKNIWNWKYLLSQSFLCKG